MRRMLILAGLTVSSTALIAPIVATADASSTSPSAKVDDVRSRVAFHYKDARIKESSGIETSTRFRTITYTHNDSGDTSRFFAIGRRAAPARCSRCAARPTTTGRTCPPVPATPCGSATSVPTPASAATSRCIG